MGLNGKKLHICLEERDWMKFHSMSAAIGVTPSTLGRIFLKQALSRYSPQEGLDGFVLQWASPALTATRAIRLSPREIEVLNIIAQGISNKTIASTLGIGEQTIKNHITSILHKLKASSRTQAVILALRHNLIEPQIVETRDTPAEASRLIEKSQGSIRTNNPLEGVRASPSRAAKQKNAHQGMAELKKTHLPLPKLEAD